MGSKFNGVVGIARSADASTPVSPAHILQCGTATIDGEPIVYEREANASLDIEGAEYGGHKHTWSIDGIEAPIGHLGYILWLLLGSETYSSGHILTPGTAQQYACIQIMRNPDLDLDGSTHPTEVLLGGKINRARLEITKKGFGKLALAGVGADRDHAAALTRSTPTGADNAPVSWAALKGSGYVHLGYDAAAGSDTEIRRVALEVTQALNDDDGVDLGSDQPTQINEGRRTVTWQFDKLFSGNARDAYEAWLNQQIVTVDVNLVVGAYSANLISGKAHVVGRFAQEIGASEEAVMATLECRANKGNGLAVALSATVVDGVGVAYT